MFGLTPLPDDWTFEGCEQGFRFSNFVESLTYFFFDIYIATILYKWACLADEEQPAAKNNAKISPETAVELESNSIITLLTKCL